MNRRPRLVQGRSPRLRATLPSAGPGRLAPRSAYQCPLKVVHWNERHTTQNDQNWADRTSLPPSALLVDTVTMS